MLWKILDNWAKIYARCLCIYAMVWIGNNKWIPILLKKVNMDKLSCWTGLLRIPE